MQIRFVFSIFGNGKRAAILDNKKKQVLSTKILILSDTCARKESEIFVDRSIRLFGCCCFFLSPFFGRKSSLAVLTLFADARFIPIARQGTNEATRTQ